jgi:hypothetical protein
MAPQTAISKAFCYKTKNEQLWEKAVHFLLVATNCFYAGLPTVFCTITRLKVMGLNGKRTRLKGWLTSVLDTDSVKWERWHRM